MAGQFPMVTGGGAANGCAVTGGAAYAWGSHASALVLGAPPLDPSDSTMGYGHAVPVTGLSSGVTDIDCRGYFACVVQDRGVKCWGSNSHGQLGIGSVGGRRDFPAPQVVDTLVNPLTNIVAVATGDPFACALSSEGMVFCWGANTRSQLGDGTTTTRSSAVAVKVSSSALLEGASKLAVGTRHACALVLGKVLCWGDNSNMQIDDSSGNTIGLATETKVSSP